jgi:hypothetical protein
MSDETLKISKIEDHRPAAVATHTITYTLDGFQITSVIETAAPIRQIVDKLKSIGAEPPLQNLQKPEPTKTAGAPLCPTHGTAMKASRKPGSYFCPRRGDDGDYCPHKA